MLREAGHLVPYLPKQPGCEQGEVERARAAQRVCERGHASGHPGHGPAREIYERKWD